MVFQVIKNVVNNLCGGYGIVIRPDGALRPADQTFAWKSSGSSARKDIIVETWFSLREDELALSWNVVGKNTEHCFRVFASPKHLTSAQLQTAERHRAEIAAVWDPKIDWASPRSWQNDYTADLGWELDHKTYSEKILKGRIRTAMMELEQLCERYPNMLRPYVKIMHETSYNRLCAYPHKVMRCGARHIGFAINFSGTSAIDEWQEFVITTRNVEMLENLLRRYRLHCCMVEHIADQTENFESSYRRLAQVIAGNGGEVRDLGSGFYVAYRGVERFFGFNSDDCAAFRFLALSPPIPATSQP